MTPRQSVLSDVMSRHAFHLALGADTYTPDAEDSAGARFLSGVRDDVVAEIEYAASASLQEDALDGVLDNSGSVADAAVPTYTHDLWAAFVDLGAYREDLTEYGDMPTDLDQCARVALYIIADRLARSLLQEMLDADHGWVACTECGLEFDPEIRDTATCEECTQGLLEDEA